MYFYYMKDRLFATKQLRRILNRIYHYNYYKVASESVIKRCIKFGKSKDANYVAGSL